MSLQLPLCNGGCPLCKFSFNFLRDKQGSQSCFPPHGLQPPPSQLPGSILPQPAGCFLMPRANPAATQVVSRPLAVKQPRGGVHVCTTDLPTLPLARMAPVVNKIFLRDKQQNHWSGDRNAVYPILRGQFTCLDSVLFSVSCLLACCPLYVMSCPFLALLSRLFVFVFHMHTSSIYCFPTG